MLNLLLIDDDARLPDLLRATLAPHGVTVAHAADGPRGLIALGLGGGIAAADAFDAVLLDVMLPGMDGLDVLRRIRARSPVPVLMLTARGDEADRIVGLELGADDYVAKPFSGRELLARVRAVLRRTRPDAEAETLLVGALRVDVPGRVAEVGGHRVELTAVEFDLLVALVRRAGRAVSRETLLREAGRGGVSVGERTVDVHVGHVRQKLGDATGVPRIQTVRGIGYVLAREARP